MFQLFSGLFIRMFANVSCGCCICLQWFLNVFQTFFASVSDACFKCFIYLILYVTTVTSGCFKNRSGVAHGIHVGSSWQHGPTAGAVAREPDVLGARSLRVRAPSGHQNRRARRSLTPYTGTFWTLAPGLNVRALANPITYTPYHIRIARCQSKLL
jgi:hypothetical protein